MTLFDLVLLILAFRRVADFVVSFAIVATILFLAVRS